MFQWIDWCTVTTKHNGLRNKPFVKGSFHANLTNFEKFPWVPFQSHNSSEILPFENHHRFCPRWFWGFLQFLKASKLLSINGIDLKLSAVVLVFPENYWENKNSEIFCPGSHSGCQKP